MKPGRDESRNVRHIDHEPGTDEVRDLPELREVDQARIRAGSGNDQGRLLFPGERLYLIVVDPMSLFVDPVGDDVEPFAR